MRLFTIFDKLIQKSAFTEVTSFENELKKISLIRIFLGILIFVRFSEIFHSVLVLEYEWKLLLISIAFLSLLFCFIIGFFSVLVSMLILVSALYYDQLIGTFTLGTQVLVITLIAFVLINPGHYYSVDRYILKRKGIISKSLILINSFWGAKNKNDITRAYFLVFLVYAIISLASVKLHLQDENWMAGSTVKILLLNPYLCKYYSIIHFIDQSVPYLLAILSKSAILFQSTFQLLMIPMIFFKLGKKFVFYWGVMFFLISLFFINLSYLPHVELIMWILIFIPVSTTNNPVEVFYDDYCNLCKRTMRFFKYINFNENIIFRPLSKYTAQVQELNISEKELKAYMVGIANKKVYVGFDLYIKICLLNPLLYIFLPLLFLGKITKLGPQIYNYIADRRYRFFGTCKISFQDEIAKKEPVLYPTKTGYLSNALFFMYLFTFAFFSLNILGQAKHTLYSKIAFSLGFITADVFNSTDLAMGDAWMEIYRYDEENKLIMVPITGHNGERLNYSDCDILHLTNHNSDVLYYNITLPFRREAPHTEVSELMEKDHFGWENLEKRITYDYKLNEFTNQKTYLVRVYRNNASKVDLYITNYEDFNNELVFEGKYLFRDNSMSLVTQSFKTAINNK